MTPSGAEFACRRCGNCCRIRGTVRILPGEDVALATVLGLGGAEFVARFTRIAPDRSGLILADDPDGACCFLATDGSCRVQAAKPLQCRAFPLHWNYPGWEARCAAAAAGTVNERKETRNHED